MFNQTLIYLVVGAALVVACDGDISNGLSPGPDRGAAPDQDVPDQDITAAFSASDGWRSVKASAPAFDTLEFGVMARAEVANIDALVAVGNQDIADFSDAAVKVRFTNNGIIVAGNGDEADIDFWYEPGVWYEIRVLADIGAGTYDVEVGPRGGPSEVLTAGASFDSEAGVIDRLTTWAAWSSQTAKLDIAEPHWIASGRCAPATCQSLVLECGDLGDGCGGTLNCGGCASDQTCSAGVCMDVPSAPPSCMPESCLSLNLECGEQADGCGGTLNCGDCASDQTCSAGACIDVPSAPPASCLPENCLSLDVECGEQANGCGGTLNCGGCASNQTCSAGVCMDVPSAPPSCVPENCLSLDVQCGQRADGCGGTLNCGGCPSEQACSGGLCIDASSPPGGEVCNASGTCTVSANFEMNDKGAMQTDYACVSPCWVLFDATEREAMEGGGGGDPEWPITRHSDSGVDPFVDIHYTWDFDDPTSGTWAVTGKSRNVGYGPIAGHLYETAEGSGQQVFTVTMTATGPDGATDTVQKTVTVTDAAVKYASTTTCVSRTPSESDWSGCPSSATRLDGETGNWNTLVDSRIAAGDRRILFKRGQSWSANGTVDFDVQGPGIVSSFGSGNRPMITFNTSRAMFELADTGDGWWTLADINVQGPGSSSDWPSVVSYDKGGKPGQFAVIRLDVTEARAQSFLSLEGNGLAPDDDVAQDVLAYETKWFRLGQDGGSCNFVAVRRFALMGNEWQSCEGEHILRHQFADTVLHSNNFFADPPSGKNLVNVRDWNCDKHNTFACVEDSGHIVHSDNYLGTGSFNAVKRAGGGASGNFYGHHVLAERNFCFWTDYCIANPALCNGTNGCVSLTGDPSDSHWVRDVAIRNNICNMDYFESGRCFNADGDNAVIENNVCYTAHTIAGSTNSCVDYDAGDNGEIRNNVLYQPNDNGTVIRDQPGSAVVESNLTASTNPFAVANPGRSNPNNYRPAAGSALIDTGAPSPYRRQGFSQQVAPQDCDGDSSREHNVGAFEVCL